MRSSYALAMNTARSKAREQIARVLATERQEVTTEEVKVAPGGEPLETKRTKREDLAGFGETNVTQVDELDGVLWVEVCSGPATAPLVPR